MRAADPDPIVRRTDRKTCPSCGASVAGCDGNRWLRGRWCCDACRGDHDRPITATKETAS